jgi:hypothetical protein
VVLLEETFFDLRVNFNLPKKWGASRIASRIPSFEGNSTSKIPRLNDPKIPGLEVSQTIRSDSKENPISLGKIREIKGSCANIGYNT